MAADQGLIWIIFILSLLQLVNFSQAMEAVMCYDCTSWNSYCANSVKIPFPEAVATVECNITKTCFIRKERDEIISRGCADRWMFSSVTSDYLGCQEQVPLGMKPQEWCFCDTDYCNGKSMDDIKQLNGQKHDLHLQDTRSQDDKKQKSPSHHNNHHKDTNEQVISSKGALGLQETTQKWWKNSKVAKLSDVPAVPTGPTGPVGVQGDRQEDTEHVDTKQNLKDEEDGKTDIEQKDNFENDFFCWDCYSDNPFCGEMVKTPVTYYVGRVACPITKKCFIRKDKGVIYRGCADGWKYSTIDYLYVGCKNQTMWDRNVEWCFCSSPYCNVQSMDSLRNNHPIIVNAANEQGQVTHKKLDDK